MLKSSLHDYNDAYIPVQGTITVSNTTAPLCTPLTDSINKMNNKQLDNAKDIDVVTPMYNLREYSGNYLKTSGSLWQYYRNEPADNNSALFKFKQEITGKTDNNGIKDVEVIVFKISK